MGYPIVKRRFPENLGSNHGDYQFACFCPKCGAESYGLFQFKANHDQSIKLAQHAYSKAEQAAVCPICGNILHKERGYFMPDKSFEGWNNFFDGSFREYPLSAQAMFGVMAAWRNQQEVLQMHQIAEAFVSDNDLPAASMPAQIDPLSPDELKKYILTLINLKNNIYSLKQLLPQLYYQRLLNDRRVVFATHEAAYKLKAVVEEKQAAYQLALNELRDAEAYQPKVSVHYPKEPTAPVLGKPGMFNKKKVQEENDALLAQYQAALNAYKQEVLRCEEEKACLIAEQRAAVIATAQNKADAAKAALDEAEHSVSGSIAALEAPPFPAHAIKELLDKEIVEAEELLKKTITTRNALYARNIVFAKYRNAVALSSFYEYLLSGRCTALEGADGAYNIYENEIRMNLVIAQLDTVISSLEDIKQNQYMMYQELCSINTSLQHLNNTMDKALTSIQTIEANTTQMSTYMESISKNSDVIAHSTAATAYYSKINAELTNALGYMVAFK